jgi:cytidylate kinase
MAYRVVTIARTLGAGGEDVAHAVAGKLGFRHVDDEIIVKAAAKAGVSPEEVERAEQRRPLVLRLIDAMATTPTPDALDWAPGTFVPSPRSSAYHAFITEVIEETAQEGDAVIVAHGAGVPLGGRPDVLRVFVTASPARRCRRLIDALNIDERKPAAEVPDSDKSRADFLQRFYGLKDELPTTYDLVVNTDALSVDEAAKIIVAAATT